MNAQLLQRREAIRTQMRQRLNTAADGDLSPEGAEAHDRDQAELIALESRIDRELWLDEADRRATGHSLGDNRFDTQVQQFSLRRAIASACGLAVDGGLEREVSTELSRRLNMPVRGILIPLQIFQQRVVTTTTPAGGPGGTIIPTDLLAGEYIDILRPRLIVARLGARTLSGLVGDVDIPSLTVSAAATWVAENSALTAADNEWDPVTLRPRTVGRLMEYSRLMLLQSSPDIETLMRDDFAAKIAGAIDAAALNGGGANEPLGVLARITPTAAAAITWAGIVGLETTVLSANSVGTGYAMAPGVQGILKSKVKLTGATDSQVMMDTPGVLAGYPAEVSTGCPTGTLIFGNWADVLIGIWSAFDFLANPFAEGPFSKGNVQVRGMGTIDVNLRHVQSFAALNAIAS